MKNDLDDIVFEERNRDYGSFILRKFYHKGLLVAVSSAILLGFISVFIPYLIYLEESNNKVFLTHEVFYDELPDLSNAEGLPEPPESNTKREAVIPDISNLTESRNEQPFVVDSVIVEDSFLESSMDSIMRDQIQQIPTGSGNRSTGEKSNTFQPDNHVYTHVDRMPIFKGGGIEEFREWVMKKTKYPKEASIRGIEGKVLISFVIEKDGTVSTVEVLRGVDPLIDNEAIKSVKSSPRWTPGMIRSAPIRVSYIISINFEL